MLEKALKRLSDSMTGKEGRDMINVMLYLAEDNVNIFRLSIYDVHTLWKMFSHEKESDFIIVDEFSKESFKEWLLYDEPRDTEQLYTALRKIDKGIGIVATFLYKNDVGEIALGNNLIVFERDKNTDKSFHLTEDEIRQYDVGKENEETFWKYAVPAR